MLNEILTSINSTDFSTVFTPGLCHYLILALIIFITGITMAISSANLIKILIGAAFMLNAVCINFIAADAFITPDSAPINAIEAAESTLVANFAPVSELNFNFSSPEGQVAGFITIIFVITNIALGLGLVCVIFSKLKTSNLNNMDKLKSGDCPDSKVFGGEI